MASHKAALQKQLQRRQSRQSGTGGMILKTDTPTRITVRPAITPIKADGEVGKENATDAAPGSARRDDYLDRNTIELPAEDRTNRPRHRLDEMLAEEGVDAGYHPEGAESVRRDARRAEEPEYKQRSPPREQSRAYEPRSIEKSSGGGRGGGGGGGRGGGGGGSGGGGGGGDSGGGGGGGGGGGYERRDEYEPRKGEREPTRQYDDDRDRRDDREYRDADRDRERDASRDRDRDRERDAGRDRERDRDDRERYDREDRDRERDSRERQRDRDSRDRELDAQHARRERDYDERRDRDDREREGSRTAQRMPSEMYTSEAPVGQSRSNYPDEYGGRREEREPEGRSLEFVQGKAQREAAAPQQGGSPAAVAGGRMAEAEAEAEEEYPMVSPTNSSSAEAAAPAAASGGGGGGGGGASSLKEDDPIYFDTADPQALLNFVSSPAPEISNKIRCEIKRDKKGIGKGSYPVYYLRLERPNAKDPSKTDKVFLLAGRKRKKSKSSNYLISVDSMDLSRDSDSFVAKLRSNFVGTSFTIFDNGESMKNKELSAGKEYRKELGGVLYETNILGYKGPRKMTVVIPAMDHERQPMEFRPLREADQLMERVKLDRMDDLVQMTNKSPTWSEESMSYVLNFGGRVTMASVKNFQIVHAKDPDYVVLQFGRVAEHHFTMDFQYPMSAIQAFAICLSSLDGKLACE